ncbi:MAG: hypothetical protein QOE45_2510 [Frankiaceae bacterium]|jgi:hypothetical protein|nr:hypothetical protein [Frankiaceae bacterium]
MESLRYLHLGADPLAKRLYSVVFDALTTFQEAKALLEQYLTARDTPRVQP